MDFIWNLIDRHNWEPKTKYIVCLASLSILAALAGYCVWTVLFYCGLFNKSWLIAFMGYPVLAAWLSVFFYACRHSFSRKARPWD